MAKRRARRAEASQTSQTGLPTGRRGATAAGAGTPGAAEPGGPQRGAEAAVEPDADPAFELEPQALSEAALPETELDEDDTDDAAAETDARSADAASPRSLVPRSSALPQDALTRYFQDISKYPLLSRERERQLAVRVQEHGDAEAAQTLVLSNLRLVVRIAMEYRRVWTNLLDLIQEGNVGLLQAVRRFDPQRGVKLSSYGAYWIRAYILKYLIDNIRTVRMGSSRAERKIFYSLSRARRELERQGFAPTPALLAERLDVKPEDVEQVERRLSQSDMSLDAPLSTATGASTLGERQSTPGQSLDDSVSQREMQQTFRSYVERFGADLDERETVILRERMLADEPVTLQEIGDRFGLTRERVRQIEKKMVDRLRDYLKENLVDFDYWAPED